MVKEKIKTIKKYISEFTIYGRLYLVIFLTLFVLLKFIFILSPVVSGSMENTIMTGDIVLGSRMDCENINRYDILIFKAPDEPKKYFTKRVIGLPGDFIEIMNGVVYVNGQIIDDSFIKEPMVTTGKEIFEVPEDSFFMLGDNRNASNDSRYWAHPFVHKDAIVGKIKWRLLPFDRAGNIQ